MSNGSPTLDAAHIDDDEPPAYEPPAVIWEEKWEPLVLAASCARVPGMNDVCNASAHSP